MEITNAKIASTMLGYGGHGLLTLDLTLDYGGSMQSFGGYRLSDGHDLHRHITNILKVVGVDTWEELKGKYIRVEREKGWNTKINRIGNLLDDKWFDPTSQTLLQPRTTDL